MDNIEKTRDDFIAREHYTSESFAQLEAEKLWPNVWQMACRLEDIPVEGSYTTYEILNYLIVLVRGESGSVKAFHNVCPHRGNQIAFGSGNINKLTCRFHGWQWSLDGEIKKLKEREDWAECSHFTDEDLSLQKIHTATWAGFVFINLAKDPEPFEQFIDPVPYFLGCLEFEKMTYIWSKTVKLKANWKTAMESFMESYHLETTHPQTIPFLDGLSESFAHGKHGKHGYPNARPTGAPATCSGKPMPDDIREGYVTAIQALADQIGGAVGSQRSASAVRKIMDELTEDASPIEVITKGTELMLAAAEADGSGCPTVTPEQGANLGVDWNIFPNMVLVFSLDTVLVMRALPAANSNECTFDMWGLMRQPPGKQIKVEREYYEDWRSNRDKIPYLLVQDLSNIETIQKGMMSPAFKGARTNPVQERQISHHHRVLEQYLK